MFPDLLDFSWIFKKQKLVVLCRIVLVYIFFILVFIWIIYDLWVWLFLDILDFCRIANIFRTVHSAFLKSLRYTENQDQSLATNFQLSALYAENQSVWRPIKWKNPTQMSISLPYLWRNCVCACVTSFLLVCNWLVLEAPLSVSPGVRWVIGHAAVIWHCRRKQNIPVNLERIHSPTVACWIKCFYK